LREWEPHGVWLSLGDRERVQVDQTVHGSDDDGEVYDWGPPEDVVTESLLADVFGVDAAVTYDDEPRIVPRRALD
jgi:ABC-type cobalamin/Fe3+-siderophores transport system ATPase subunit